MGNEILAAQPNAMELIDGQPRVRDTALAEWLEFAEPRAIRKIIARWSRVPTDPTQAPVIAPIYRDTVSRQFTGKGASRLNTINEAWLSEEEALFIAAKSETKKAVAVTRRVIAEFMRLRHESARPALPAPAQPEQATPYPQSRVPAHLIEPLEACAALASKIQSSALAMACVRAQSDRTRESVSQLLVALADEQARWAKLYVQRADAVAQARVWIPTIVILVARLVQALDGADSERAQA